jgi:hypothetical protein
MPKSCPKLGLVLYFLPAKICTIGSPCVQLWIMLFEMKHCKIFVERSSTKERYCHPPQKWKRLPAICPPACPSNFFHNFYIQLYIQFHNCKILQLQNCSFFKRRSTT